MQTLLQDLRYGFRMLGKNSGFTAIAVLTLAFGIGANTAIFSLLDALFLKPLPGIGEPDRLVEIGRTHNGQGFDSVSYPDYRDYRDQASTLRGSQPKVSNSFISVLTRRPPNAGCRSALSNVNRK